MPPRSRSMDGPSPATSCTLARYSVCTNDHYEACMADACRRAVAEGFGTIAFGDLYLKDVRAYRERQLTGSGLTPVFPLWEIPTSILARDMIDGGLRARLSCIDSKQL